VLHVVQDSVAVAAAVAARQQAGQPGRGGSQKEGLQVWLKSFHGSILVPVFERNCNGKPEQSNMWTSSATLIGNLFFRKIVSEPPERSRSRVTINNVPFDKML